MGTGWLASEELTSRSVCRPEESKGRVLAMPETEKILREAFINAIAGALGAAAGKKLGAAAGQKFQQLWESRNAEFAEKVAPIIEDLISDLTDKYTRRGIHYITDGDAKRALTDALERSSEFSGFAQSVLSERGLPLYWV
jgi:hypothetical protein